MAGIKARGATTITYNAQNITQYVTQADLERTLDRVDTTTLSSTAVESIAGDETNSIRLQGNWKAALDTILAPDVGSGTKRTAVIAYGDGAATVTYTWTANAEIENYSISSPANGLRTFSCDLMLSGAPTRVVS